MPQPERLEKSHGGICLNLDQSRQGVVRHIHPGGQYVKGDADDAALQAKIEELLAER